MKRVAWGPIGGAVSLALAGSVLADPTEIYFNDFENGKAGSEWGANKVITNAKNFSHFMGRYSQFDAIKLKLPVPGGVREGLRPGQSLQYGVTFDFYCIDSWDGSEPTHGIDSFQVLVDGTQWFSETFANVHDWQTFREPDIGRSHLGFNPKWKDSIYLDVSVPFLVDDWRDAFSITFRSRNLLNMDDESWGIDNVHVWYDIVPAPGTAALLGLGALSAARRRR
jgi:hypothetical protein